MIKQAVVLVGGKGTRLFPITYEIPKPLLPVKGKPILQHQLELLEDFGIEHVVLALGYKADMIMDFVKRYNPAFDVDFSIEKEPLGTGGALKNALELLDEHFFVLNGDILAEINLVEMGKEHLSKDVLATIALAKVDDVSSFGVVAMDESGLIFGFVEKPKPSEAPSNLVNAGIYAMEKSSIELLPDGFSMVEKDLFPKLAQQKKLAGYVVNGRWIDIGTWERYARAIMEW